ncbi:MAG: D-Ala-D-Ala carboxypeptidase family metallohydrolase [Candidatus Cloacimonetes bacterium]|nr:D-Ala-D-Ala carboxypeptidase family metallohydrolase [Candidatus Cloacimonadota bacterium]MDY0171589.1 D-Ala-D-Ala carboxypeptidase family metallohydrolase [Candidatus Cloacimonadaceae bacterium]
MQIQVANNYIYGAPGTGFTVLDTADFSGMAGFLLTSEDTEVLKNTTVPARLLSTSLDAAGNILGDLLITDVTFAYTDHHHLTPYIGDYFSLHYFGKAPLVLNVQGVLLDTSSNLGKENFQSWYRHVLRLSQVALTGVAPHLCFRGYMVQGAMLGLSLSESAEGEGQVAFSFEYLVFTLKLNNPTNTALGITGVEVEYNRVLTPSAYEEAAEASYSVKEIKVSSGGEPVSVTDEEGNRVSQASDYLTYPTTGPYYASEFKCRCNGKYCTDNKISSRLISLLNESAKSLGKFPVNSGYRCYLYNAAVGGKSSSYHTRGLAADLAIPKSMQAKACQVFKQLGFKGFGFYNTFLHVDLRSYHATWKG